MNQILNNNILQWQPVKRSMTYPDFVATFPRDERIKHCNFNEIKKDERHTHATGKSSGQGSKKDKAGQILGPSDQMAHAVENLKKFILDEYNIELIGARTVHVPLCHLCAHGSTINKKDSTKHTCTNQFHVYFGTITENNRDIDPVVKSVGGSASTKSPNHSCQVKDKCPYCNFETIEWNLKGRHIPACHFNPTSKYYLTPITHSYTKNVYRQQGLGHKLIELKLMIAENYNSRHQ